MLDKKDEKTLSDSLRKPSPEMWTNKVIMNNKGKRFLAQSNTHWLQGAGILPGLSFEIQIHPTQACAHPLLQGGRNHSPIEV